MSIFRGGCVGVLALLAAVLALTTTANADTLELRDGGKLVGKVISQDAREVRFRVMFASGSSMETVVPADRVRSVTISDDDLPKVVPSKPAAPGPAKKEKTSVAPDRTVKLKKLTDSQITALIRKVGPTPPEWWDEVKLNYPKTLDLSWPIPAPKPWNTNRNAGQFLYGVIHPNESRWREGVKFTAHLMTVNKDNRNTLHRIVAKTGWMYHNLLEDHVRGAFWLRKARKMKSLNLHQTVMLAECYFELGSKRMAVRVLKGKRQYSLATVKLWSKMGEYDKAMSLVKRMFRRWPGPALVTAGDVARRYGRYTEALGYYERVLALTVKNRSKNRNIKRAKASIEAIRLFETLDVKKVSDGKYKGSSVSFVGPLHVEVTVSGGRIESIDVRHQDKQFYSSIADTPRQIIAKQSVRGIDTTTRATITSEAIINATAKALSAAPP